MVTRGSLDIRGFKGAAVPNVFYQQEAEADALCIVFGGWHYTTDMPIFYYLRQVLGGLGFDVLAVDFDHASDRRYARLSDRNRQKWFLAEVDSVFNAATARRRYRRVCVAAKSIGTMAIAHLILAGRVGNQAKLVWLSPIVEAESIQETLRTCTIPSLVVVGNRDVQFSPSLLKKLSRNRKLDIMIIERANEDLEVDGDAVRSIELLVGLLGRLRGFLGTANDKVPRRRRVAD
jgi:hypothetical protein